MERRRQGAYCRSGAILSLDRNSCSFSNCASSVFQFLPCRAYSVARVVVRFLSAMDWTRAAVSMSMLSNIGQSHEAFQVEMRGTGNGEWGSTSVATERDPPASAAENCGPPETSTSGWASDHSRSQRAKRRLRIESSTKPRSLRRTRK